MIKIISHNISGAGYREGKERVLKPFVLENVLSKNPDVVFFLEYAFPSNHEEVVKWLNNAGYNVKLLMFLLKSIKMESWLQSKMELRLLLKKLKCTQRIQRI